MFTQLDGSKVISDEGFEIEISVPNNNSGGIAYREQGRAVHFGAGYSIIRSGDSVQISGPLEIGVPESFSWADSREIPLSVADRTRILNNIRQAFQFLNLPYRIVSALP
jgi:hypothetical protein